MFFWSPPEFQITIETSGLSRWTFAFLWGYRNSRWQILPMYSWFFYPTFAISEYNYYMNQLCSILLEFFFFFLVLLGQVLHFFLILIGYNSYLPCFHVVCYGSSKTKEWQNTVGCCLSFTHQKWLSRFAVFKDQVSERRWKMLAAGNLYSILG